MMALGTAEKQGILWMIGNSFWFACTTSIVRHLSGDLHPFVMLFFRNAFAIPVLLLFIAPAGNIFGTNKLKMHFLRAFVAMAAMGAWFYAITVMPLPEATALSFTTPLFTAIAAIVLLKETAGKHRWSAIIIGFIGALVIIHPRPGAFNMASFIVLLAAIGWALSNVQAKSLSATEDPKRMVFYLTLFMMPLSLILAIPVWKTPNQEQILWLIVMSLVSNFSHFCLSKAVSKTQMTVILPFDFMRLIFIAAIAYVAFSQKLDMWTVIGGVIIVGSNVYIARREAMLKKQVIGVTPAD
jgi:drug/metabolite transporter (DMT)-like permease